LQLLDLNQATITIVTCEGNNNITQQNKKRCEWN